MARTLHYLMATSFVVLVMIHSNSLSCQALCFGPWCKPRPPCFQPPDNHCTDGRSCVFICQYHGHKTYKAYCKQPKNPKKPVYLCCCPP
nr:unnamed protein product [Digitaria exilis]